jgi:hypothetical protein
MSMIKNQFVEVVPNNLACYYKKLGYDFKKNNEKITINVVDLPVTSGCKVKCVCNECGAEFLRIRSIIKNPDETFCKEHRYEKTKITCREKYGVDNVSELQSIKDKKESTRIKNKLNMVH